MRTPQQQQAIDGVDELVEYIEQLEQERDYLDGRCAELEKQVARLELRLAEKDGE